MFINILFFGGIFLTTILVYIRYIQFTRLKEFKIKYLFRERKTKNEWIRETSNYIYIYGYGVFGLHRATMYLNICSSVQTYSLIKIPGSIFLDEKIINMNAEFSYLWHYWMYIYIYNQCLIKAYTLRTILAIVFCN